MKPDLTETGSFNEEQSLRLIRDMIELSHRKLKNNGILFIIWGWIGCATCFAQYYIRTYAHTFLTDRIISHTGTLAVLGGIIFTIIYLFLKSRRATTYISISLRYVWASLFGAMVLINLIQFNVLHKVIFELQHPLFMVVVAFATVITGGILRYKMIFAGGILFGLLAYLSSYLSLNNQLLVESVAWLIAFVIPGHILYSRRNK